MVFSPTSASLILFPVLVDGTPIFQLLREKQNKTLVASIFDFFLSFLPQNLLIRKSSQLYLKMHPQSEYIMLPSQPRPHHLGYCNSLHPAFVASLPSSPPRKPILTTTVVRIALGFSRFFSFFFITVILKFDHSLSSS